VIEAEVHSSLRAFLRFAKSNTALLSPEIAVNWPHHLTMARLVARALRLGRSALIQTGLPTGTTHGRYRLSYLAPALIWSEPVILVTTTSVQQRLLQVEIPQLQQWLQTAKAIQTGTSWPDANFQGLLLTSPEDWLADRLTAQDRFPSHIPTIIDGADDLEVWARDLLTACLQPQDWDALMQACPEQAEVIRDTRVELTKAVFQHPPNPYECCLIEEAEQKSLQRLYAVLKVESPSNLPDSWQNFWHRWQTDGQLLWATIARSQGQFSLYCGSVAVGATLSPIWPQQPVVLIGGGLDLEPEASVYRQQLGLGELTCLKFSPDPQSELIQLYVPDQLPMPNTPQYQQALIRQVSTLLHVCTSVQSPIVFLIGDVPLKAQVATILAAQFGSRVQVEKTNLDETSILVAGWEFWRQHQAQIPPPQLLIIATLPIPSLEDPLVAGRVAYYKQRRQDWFRLYLLPAALRELQRAIAPVRDRQGVVAILDNRVNNRSYGQQVLTALSPLARINYPDARWFTEGF